jgi:hypothetical protein
MASTGESSAKKFEAAANKADYLHSEWSKPI